MEVKNKKGFTLIEILAVIVLISLIIIIAVPSVKSISIKSKKKLFDTKVKLTEEAVNLWGINNKTCFELESAGCNVLDNCYIESNIYTCETTFGILAQHGIINYDEEYKGVRYIVNPIDSGSMNDFKLFVTLNNNNKIVNTDFDDEDESVKFVPIDRDETTETTSSSGSASNQVVKYSVVYWLQNVGAGTAENSSNYEKTKTEEKEGISGENVTPEVSLYTGFNSPEPKTVTIKSDGSTVVNYYYTRNSYTVTLNRGTGISSVSGAGTYQYGQAVTINATVSSGYTWNKWSGTHSITTQEFTFTMPAYNVTDTANVKLLTVVAQAIYSADDNSLTFVKQLPIDVGDSFSFKDKNGITKTKTASAVYTGFDKTSYSYNNVPWNVDHASDITSVYVADTGIKPKSTSHWFYKMKNCSDFDITKLDTSAVTNMSYMFFEAGSNVKNFDVNLSNFNTSSVTNMYQMFLGAGRNSTTFHLNLSNWDTSSVTNMKFLFREAGENSTTWNIDGLSTWDTSNVKDMSCLFDQAAEKVTSFELDLSTWDTSNVTDMSNVFYKTAVGATNLNLNLTGWNTSNVEDMSAMFWHVGSAATNWSIIGLDSWDTSNVTDMDMMFYYAGKSAGTFNLNLSNWNTSRVTNMRSMLDGTGYNSSSWTVGDLSNWDTSNVTNMSYMFSDAAYKSSTWNIGDIAKWNTSNVTDMSYMFSYAGNNASYKLDLSGWDVRKVTSYDKFNLYVTSKVISPSFGIS